MYIIYIYLEDKQVPGRYIYDKLSAWDTSRTFPGEKSYTQGSRDGRAHHDGSRVGESPDLSCEKNEVQGYQSGPPYHGPPTTFIFRDYI